MSEMTILIFDRNPHQKEYFVSSFQEEKVPVLEADTLTALNELVDPQQQQFALLDYTSLVAEDRDAIVRLFRALKNEMAVVFNVPLDATKRIVFYELGALRVYDEGTSIEEVYRNVRWWMQVYKKSSADVSADVQGDLQSVDFLNLLWGMAGGNQSGVLKITTRYNMGEIFFNHGQIIEVRVLNHRGLDAFLHLVLWNEGRFTFRQLATDEIEPSVYMTLSGLLILAQDLKTEMQAILREFKSESCVLQAVNLGDLPLYGLDIDPQFLEFISIPRELAEVLENPYYPNHETLRLLAKLKHFGLLRLNEPLESMIEQNEVFADGVQFDQQTVSEIAGDLQKIDAMSQILGLQSGEQAKIVIIAQNQELLKHYLNTLAESAENVFLENNMYFVRLRLAEKLEMILIGLRANHELLRLLSVLSENIHGFVFLFDARHDEQKEYLSYLINQVLAQYRLPSVAAVTYLEKEQTIEAISREYRLSVRLPWLSYSANNQTEMLEVILNLHPLELPEDESNSAESEAEK